VLGLCGLDLAAELRCLLLFTASFRFWYFDEAGSNSLALKLARSMLVLSYWSIQIGKFRF
jgi:hypothetical protein